MDSVVGRKPGSCEVRLKRLYTPPSGPPGRACALVSGFPLKEDGKVRYLMGCFTDVSRLKWAESVQSLNAAAAREAKRQQEDFIDVTSHELRNPLGVVVSGLLRTTHVDPACVAWVAVRPSSTLSPIHSAAARTMSIALSVLLREPFTDHEPKNRRSVLRT